MIKRLFSADYARSVSLQDDPQVEAEQDLHKSYEEILRERLNESIGSVNESAIDISIGIQNDIKNCFSSSKTLIWNLQC